VENICENIVAFCTTSSKLIRARWTSGQKKAVLTQSLDIYRISPISAGPIREYLQRTGELVRCLSSFSELVANIWAGRTHVRELNQPQPNRSSTDFPQCHIKALRMDHKHIPMNLPCITFRRSWLPAKRASSGKRKYYCGLGDTSPISNGSHQVDLRLFRRGEKHIQRGRGLVCEEFDQAGVLERPGVSRAQGVDESGEGVR
jgi:hypothetical protein